MDKLSAIFLYHIDEEADMSISMTDISHQNDLHG